jgi:hypothetical protein
MNGLNSLWATRPWKLVGGALAATLLAVGCGGGGDGGVGTGGTGSASSFSTGRISGLGSVIVNRVRFDDSSASVTDDDGVSHPRGDLKLGMVVDIDAGPVSTDATTGAVTGTASAIQFGDAIKGPVQSVDTAGSSLVVLGQTVKVDAATVFDGFANRLASVQAGNQVEVFAFFDTAAGTYQATRIELKTGLTEFKLRGVIAALNTSARTFALGGATIGYASAAAPLPALANGASVRVTLQTAQQGSTWIATKVTSNARAIADHAEAEAEGIVSDFVSLSNFKVNGVAVNAAGSGVVFKDGTAADVANGKRVQVEGATQAGVLVARQVEVKSAGGHDVETELHGAVESANPTARTFVLRGITVSYDTTTRIDDGVATGIVAGVQLEVRGAQSSTGNQVVATRIKFEH